MQNFVKIAGLAAAALLTLTAAGSAADLRRAAAPAPIAVAPPPPPVAYNWTGVYLGINGGWGWGESDWQYTSAGLEHLPADSDGGLIGGTIGANWQSGMWVGGVEADLDWSNISSSRACPNAPWICNTEINWLGTGRVRLGVAAGNFLLYGTGGVAFGGVRVETVNAGAFGTTTTDVGWTAGAGAEAALTRNISVKGEWLYYDLGNHGHTVDNGITVDNRETGNLFRLGLNWRM